MTEITDTDKLKKLEEAKKDLEKNLKDSSKTKKPKVPFSKRATLPKRVYFYLENKYYDLVDFISRAVPLNKLTDKIDKLFPSFILFLLIIAAIIYLLVSGTISFNTSKVYNISVEVTDSSNNQLSDALVELKLDDEIIGSQNTDVFGETEFLEIRGKGLATLIVSKENYISKILDFKLNKDNLNHIVSLDINTEYALLNSNNLEQDREIKFFNNQDLLIVSSLSVTFSCSNSAIIPEPSYKNVTNGTILVKQPANCGELRVSVSSDSYNNISNQVVPENNKVILTKNNTDKGTLTVKAKRIDQSVITDAVTNLYTSTHPEFLAHTGTTDIYGKYIFDLLPGSYLANLNKEGFLFIPKQGPYIVNVGQNTDVNLYLFTAQELQDLDCNNSIYSMFCIDGELDCSNPYLQPYLSQTDQGCTIGNIGYLNVELQDIDTNDEVIGNILLYSKLKGTDENYSSTGQIIAQESSANFSIIDLYDYQVRVSDTEDYGYISPEPYDINSLDQNIIIYLEYASELNSGTVSVNVNDTFGNNVNGAKVYLFREPLNDEEEFTLINETPEITNSQGDVNFYLQRANRDYYAFSIHNYENLQGQSSIKELDSNDILELEIDLKNTPKILNLKVNELDYDINFYNYLNEPVSNYIVNPVTGYDYNKQYIFEDDISKIYAVVFKQGFTTYQTELITFRGPNHEIFKEIEILPLSSCQDLNLVLVGLFNESGEVKIPNIDFINNTLNENYQLKFKYVSCLENKELSLAHIRAGKQQLIDNDYIYLNNLNIQSEDITTTFGYSFAGELIDWNSLFYNNNYNFDHTYSWTEDESKWLEIDFSDNNINIVEFSVGINFKKNSISPTENYVINYRAFSKDDNNYIFEPSFSNPENWSVIPQGYFYSKTNNFNIPFSDEDYIIDWNLLDYNGVPLEKTGGAYHLDIGENYKYNTNYIYLNDQNRTGDYNSTSIYTNNNLIYDNYLYIDKYNTKPKYVTINSPNLLIQDLNAYFGYYFSVKKNLSVNGFCQTKNEPKIVTKIFDPFTTPLKIPIYTYNGSAQYTVSVVSSNPNGDLFIGDNNLTFKVIDNTGTGMSDVDIEYVLPDSTESTVGTTNSSGIISNFNLPFDYSLLGENIIFNFIFDPSLGLPNNTISLTKKVMSGIYVDESTLIYNINYININDNVEYNISENTYTILNKNNYLEDVKLDSVDLSFTGGNNSKYFKINDTKAQIVSQNGLPLLLDEESKIISAPVIIKSSQLSSILETQFTVQGNFDNLIKINSSKTQSISFPALTFNFSNFGDLNFNLISDLDYGLIKETSTNLTTIELIKDKVDTINLDYNISLASLNKGVGENDITLRNIVASKVTSTVENIINLDSLNTYLQENYSNLQITTLQKTLKIPITAKEVSQDQTIFDKLKLEFNLNVDNKDITFVKEISIKVLNKDNLFIINSNDNYIINCISETECSKNIIYNITNNTDTYDLNFTKLTGNNLQSNDLYIMVSDITLPLLPSKQTNNLKFTLDSNFSKLQELGVSSIDSNLNLLFDINFANNLSNTYEKEIVVKSKYLPNVEVNWPDGIRGKLCLGVGADIQEDALFVLGDCQVKEEYSQCRSGEDALPKVRYDWVNTQSNNINWKGYDLTSSEVTCVSNSEEYDTTDKFYCDSAQLLITSLVRLGDDNSDDFYIYLVADKVSKDLLNDFIDYTGEFAVMTISDDFKNTFFNKTSVDNENFKITKNSSLPGLYKVEVNGTADEKLDLNVSLVTSIPINEVNMFYYLPIDGALGMFPDADQSRIGYGTNNKYVDSSSSEILLNSENNLKLLELEDNLENPINLNLKNYDSAFETSKIAGVLSSKGTLLNIKKIGTAGSDIVSLDLDYSPSYPVPIYARAGCYKQKNLNYVLKNGTNLVDIVPNNFLTWDFNSEINESSFDSFLDLKDSKKIMSGGNYNNHSLDLYSQLDILDINSALVGTTLYFPASQTIGNYKLFVTGIENSTNDENTYLYGLDNLQGIKAMALNSNIDNTVFSINKLFDLIKDEKACIYSSLDNTYIKWNKDITQFSSEQIAGIQEDFLSYASNCSTGQNPDNPD